MLPNSLPTEPFLLDRKVLTSKSCPPAMMCTSLKRLPITRRCGTAVFLLGRASVPDRNPWGSALGQGPHSAAHDIGLMSFRLQALNDAQGVGIDHGFVDSVLRFSIDEGFFDKIAFFIARIPDEHFGSLTRSTWGVGGPVAGQ
jgi:hypothetical protein